MAEAGELDIYRSAGFGQSARRGERPAIVAVDFTHGFTDPALPTGLDASGQIAETLSLLAIARPAGIPVLFTTISYGPGEISALPWLRKSAGMAALLDGSRLVEVDGRLAPRPDEPVIVKKGASAFHGTNLAFLLAGLRVDTVIVTGATTSGCVRASVVDAVQSGFDVLVPRDCVADRAQAPHEANLFDMQQKYVDVITSEEARSYLGAVAAKRSGRP